MDFTDARGVPSGIHTVEDHDYDVLQGHNVGLEQKAEAAGGRAHTTV